MRYVILLTSLGMFDQQEAFDLAPVLDALYQPINDISFEFEGTLRIAKKDDPLGSNSPDAFLADKFSGLYLYNSSGDCKLESYHHQSAVKNNKKINFIVTKKISTINGRTMRYEEQSGQGNAETTSSSFADYFKIGSPTYVFLIDYLKKFSKYPNKLLIKEADQKVGNVNCGVYSFVTGRDYEKGHNASNNLERYFLDYERMGNPIKIEHWIGNFLSAHTVDVQLVKVGGQEPSLWLPVFGKYESFYKFSSKNNQSQFSDVPTNTLTISIMQSSIKVNQNLKPDAFVLRLKTGSIILDGVHGNRQRVGDLDDDAPKTLKEAEDQLQRLLVEAQNKKEELLASNPIGDHHWRIDYIAWAIFTISSIAFLFLYLLARSKRGGF